MKLNGIIVEGTMRLDYSKLTVHIMKVEKDDIKKKLRDIDFSLYAYINTHIGHYNFTNQQHSFVHIS